MRISIALTTVLISLLSACSSGPSSAYVEQCLRETERLTRARFACIDQASSRERDDRAREQQETKLQGYAAKCDSYGFKRGTNQFAQCLQQA